MTLPLYSPAAPHGEPVCGGLTQTFGPRCGTCPAVPRYWLVQAASALPTGTPSTFSLTQYIQDFTQDGNVQGTILVDNGSTLNAGGRNESIWAAFPSVPIPPGSTISSATLSMTCTGSFGTTTGPTLKLDAVASSNQPEPTGSGFAGMPRTTASNTVTLALFSGTSELLTWDVTAIVQELVSASYWANNGQIMMLLENTNQNNSITASFNGLASNAGLPFTQTFLTIQGTSLAGVNVAYQQMFFPAAGTVLQRQLTDVSPFPGRTDPLDLFRSGGADSCYWESPLVSLAPAGQPNASANLWALQFITLPGNPAAQWYLTAQGLPAGVGGAPPSDHFIYDLFAGPGGLGINDSNLWFNCLAPNTFYHDSGNTDDTGNPFLMPDVVTVTPFWP